MSYLNLSPTSPRRLRRAACGRLQRGFSLLEALVSVVVLSFGLLGVAGLQANSLKYSRDARNQSVAINLAREMAEMIRSNARISGIPDEDLNPYLKIGRQLDLSTPEEYQGFKPSSGEAVGPFTGTDKDAIARAFAAAQVKDWKYRVGDALPGAFVTVCLDSAPYDTSGSEKGAPHWACDGKGNIIAIKIGWEREDTSGTLKGATDAGVRPYVVLPVTPAGQE